MLVLAPAMKLPAVLLCLGMVGVTASLGALQTSRAEPGSEAQTTYYASGQLQSETEYRDGRREGPSRRWYPDGRAMAQGSYASGKLEGRWQWWQPDGRPDLARSGLYHDGERQAD